MIHRGAAEELQRKQRIKGGAAGDVQGRQRICSLGKGSSEETEDPHVRKAAEDRHRLQRPYSGAAVDQHKLQRI
jgi:hypothetical protein